MTLENDLHYLDAVRSVLRSLRTHEPQSEVLRIAADLLEESESLVIAQQRLIRELADTLREVASDIRKAHGILSARKQIS